VASLWSICISTLEAELAEQEFNTWVRPLQAIEGEGVLKLLAPNRFVVDWVNNNLLPRIGELLRGATAGGAPIITVEIGSRARSEAPVATRAATAPTFAPPRRVEGLVVGARLNPDYDFTNFVEGKSNQLARAASQQVGENPGKAYNPFFVYGDTGRGKTHLIQAIGNQFKKLYPTRKVFYVTSEKFKTDFTDSIQAGTPNRFREKYRQYDLIIMDDVQFLAKQEKTQEELFHLFNALYDNNKQIIFSSDRSPLQIPDIADRLSGRLSSGMTIDIGEPDNESRVTIVRRKAASHGVVLANEVAEYIATSVPGSIRELEGVVNSVVCHTQVKGIPPDIAEIRQSLRSFSRPTKTVSVKNIVSKVAEFYGIGEESIYEKTRRREVVRPRQVIMYLLREDFSISYPTIGSKLGGRDHTTVIHSCEKVKREIIDNTDLAKEIQDIRTLLV